MWFFINYIVFVCESSHLLTQKGQFFRSRESERVGSGGDPCLAWPTPSRWGALVIQTLRFDSPRSWPPPCLEDGEHRISLVATADAVGSMQTCKKTDGGRQMPKQKQRNCFFSFFLSTLGTSGYSHFFKHWARLWRSLAPLDVKPDKQISEHGHFWLHRLSCEGRGGGVICSLCCINRHCPHTAVRNPCMTTHTFNTPPIHQNTRSKRLFHTIKLSFLRRKYTYFK